jgi:hypothetical protein
LEVELGIEGGSNPLAMPNRARKKNSQHSNITGDFADALVHYWLSKYGYECARVDHTGIDLIARGPRDSEVMGISVKCRDQYNALERAAVLLLADEFDKAKRACEFFRCIPYYAIVVDGGGAIRCFLTPVAHLLTIAGGAIGGPRYWRVSPQYLREYQADPLIQGFELHTQFCSWRDLRIAAAYNAPGPRS